MEFIDREKEIARLRRALDSEKRKFIVIYGRRRLGKSTLVKKILKEGDVYFEAALNEPVIEMQLLVNTIRMTYDSFADARYDSWEKLLLHFNAVCDDNATLCLDEFPYLVKKCPALPSILQRLLDSGLLRYNLIICGSSQRMMEKIILDASEPLYGRADEKICLGPIGIQYWQQAFGLDAKSAFEEFSIWGGVPRYWALREEYGSMWEAVSELVLDEHGILADEPNSLLVDDISDIAPYSSIMNALGRGHVKFSSLADAIGRKITDLSQPLKNLREMDYVRKEVPFGDNPERSRKTLYRFADPFISFYYRYVAPNKSYLALGKPERILSRILQTFNGHVADIWETTCRKAISLNEVFGEGWGVASRWWGSLPQKSEEGDVTGHLDIEFDVVASSEDRDKFLIGECKWNSADYAKRLYVNLKNRVSQVPSFAGKHVVYVLFLREKPLDLDVISKMNVHILYPEDVIALL